jgi:hypothetical protein
VTGWTDAEGNYVPDYSQTSRLDEVEEKARVNKEDISKINLKLDGTDGLIAKVAALDTEVKVNVDGRLDALEGTVGGHTTTITEHTGKLTTLETTTIPALQKAITDEANERKAVIGEVASGKTVVGLIGDVAKDLGDNYLKKTDAESTYAKKGVSYTKEEANAAIMTEEEVDARINTLIAAADPENDGKVITNLENLVEYVENNAGEIAGLITATNGNTAKLADIAENETVGAVIDRKITAAAYTLPAATVAALGGIKSAADVDGKVAENKVYVDADGNAEVKALSTDNLVQGTKVLVLNGGNAGVTAN